MIKTIEGGELGAVERHRLDHALFQCGGIFAELHKLDVEVLEQFLQGDLSDFKYEDCLRTVLKAAKAMRRT